MYLLWQVPSLYVLDVGAVGTLFFKDSGTFGAHLKQCEFAGLNGKPGKNGVIGPHCTHY